MPTLAENKKAAFNYEILQTLEAGLRLTGAEVKAAKNGRLNLKDSYVVIDEQNRAWLLNAHLAAYPPAKGQQLHYRPDHSRPLLLHRAESKAWRGKSQQAGLTILPLTVYTKGGLIKVKIALAKGRKKIDKREVIKKREIERQIQRTLRNK